MLTSRYPAASICHASNALPGGKFTRFGKLGQCIPLKNTQDGLAKWGNAFLKFNSKQVNK